MRETTCELGETMENFKKIEKEHRTSEMESLLSKRRNL